MSKISPVPSGDDLSDNLLPTEGVNGEPMDNDPVQTTSFSNGDHTNHDAIASVEKNHGWMEGPNRVDSLHVARDARYDFIDFEEQSLHQVARDGDLPMMKHLVDHYHHPSTVRKKINQKDGDRFTPLHYAARYNHYDMCQLLLQHGANLHAKGEDQQTPLHLVAKFKQRREKVFGGGDGDKSDVSSEDDRKEQQEANVRVLDFLVDAGAQVNERDFYGLTPLHHACLRGNESCVEKLLQCRGIVIEAKDRQDMTPLHAAAIYGHTNIAKILIDHGADIRCKDDDDGTPVQFAAAEGNLEIVQLIFSQCEKKKSKLKIRDLLDETDNDGNTPLHLAVDNGNFDVTNYIIEQCLACDYAAGLNAQGGNMETPLHVASKHGHIDIVKLLVEKGAKVNKRNDTRQTALFLAAQFNHSNVVEYLIQCGANIELHDVDNYTALLIAASSGHSETIEVLLQHKANVLAVDKNDKTIVYICAEEDRVDALEKLLQLTKRKIRSLFEVTDRYDSTPLHVAATNGHIGIVKILLSSGAIVDAKNEDEQTPLHMAAENGSVTIVKELVNKKREIVHDDDENGNTPLHLAALSGRAHCIKELVRLGANIAARNTKQWTPLDCCANAGMHKSAAILLEADAPVDAKDKRKQTPLHLSCIHGHRKMVELLLEWGADVSHRSVKGKNALDFAIDFGKVECASAIIESERWRDALENRTYDYKTGECIETPMRKLIRKMPSVAIQVFRKCLSDNEKHKEEFKYEITFDYEYLDDEFSCTNWIDPDEVPTSEVSMMSERRQSIQHPTNDVYEDNGRVVSTALPYTTSSSILLENHPLYVMVKSKRVDLLRHPLVISLLNHKWRSYGRLVYYVNLFVYVLFLAIFNSYALITPPPFAFDSINTNTTPPCANIQPDAQRVWGACWFRPPWHTVATYFVIVLAAIGLVKELAQMISQRLTYLKSVTNFIEVGAYVFSILLVIDISETGRITGIREAWQWQTGAAGIFLSWMGLLLFIQNFPKLGIFVLMFSDVVRTFISFSIVFVLFILGFAFSFHIVLQNQFGFNFWWNSIVKTFVMMIGEFEYENIFNSEFTDASYTAQLNYEVITYILFVVFVIIMSIIIMNLLVGLAVDDIKEVQDNAKLESLAMQVKLALDIEFTLPRWFRRRYMKKYRKFSPNKLRKDSWLSKWLYAEPHLSNNTIDEALNPEKTELQEIEQNMETLQGKVRDLRGVVYSLDGRTRKVETITQAIAKHFNIEWEDNEDDQDAT